MNKHPGAAAAKTKLQGKHHAPNSTAPIPMKVNSPLMKFWYAFVVTFLVVWALVLFRFGLFPEVTRQWPIALVMVLGSLVAGSTPIGGGGVAFPFLVLLFGAPHDSARDFGLTIQSLGMTSAMIFILCRRVSIQGRLLVWSIIGSAGGMLFGTFAIVPHVASSFVKLTFACIWMSFAALTIAKNHEFCAITGVLPMTRRAALRTGLLVGITGGIIASLIGVGTEMCVYTVLILLYRCDSRIAVPTAVSAMAVTSVIGLATHLWIGDISHDVTTKFLAAGPLVIFGAPMGTYIVSVVPRIRMLYFVSLLCVVQFGFTLYSVQPTGAEWTFVLLAMTLAAVTFSFMYSRGKAKPFNEAIGPGYLVPEASLDLE
jgi:uncharacterized membrane protein YfcA